jgi:hypothetical protein
VLGTVMTSAIQLVVTHACYRSFKRGWDLVLVVIWTLLTVLMFM